MSQLKCFISLTVFFALIIALVSMCPVANAAEKGTTGAKKSPTEGIKLSAEDQKRVESLSRDSGKALDELKSILANARGIDPETAQIAEGNSEIIQKLVKGHELKAGACKPIFYHDKDVDCYSINCGGTWKCMAAK